MARKQNSARRKEGRKKSKKQQHIPESLRHYVEGIVDMKPSGKAYILPSSKDLPDIYVAPNNTMQAFDGDKVRVLLFPRRNSVGKLEGQIVEILSRNKNYIVGILEAVGQRYFLIPDSTSIPVNICIERKYLHGAKDGEKVQVKIIEWPYRQNNPIGEVVRILGKPGENNVEMLSILSEYNFPLDYPQKAIDEAEKMSDEISDAELKKRRDFRSTYTCTIDPVDAKDFDDAISYKELDNGNVEVGVHIADVSHFVKKNSLIDAEAYERATSVYLVDRTIPMLPERLCNDLCSLKPNVDRFCFSVLFEIDPKNAKVESFWIGKGIIHSNNRFTYEEAQAVIDNYIGLNQKAAAEATPAAAAETSVQPAAKKTAKQPKISKEAKHAIEQLYQISDKLKEKRFEKGAISFHTQEVRFKLEEETAKPLGVYIKEQKEANFLVEEFMLLANRTVAEFVAKKKRVFVYRVHDEPNPEKLGTFVEFVRKLGYKMNIKSRTNTVKSFNKLLEAVKGKAEQNMIETISVRTMSKAYYSPENIGHYGLAFKYYTHFTSPIRRYPDLMVHRLLEEYLKTDKKAKKQFAYEGLEQECEHCSQMEKRAADAERTSVKYKQAEFLSDKIGSKFSGVISGVSKWGIYVALDDNYCEGMVPLRSLKDDYYELDEDNYRVVGVRTGQLYKLGDRVNISVKEVDINKKQMTFLFS